MTALAAEFLVFYAALAATFVVAPTTLDSVDVTPLDGSTGALHQSPLIAGGAAPPSLPAEVAYVITLRTGQRGRRARGRVYLPPFSSQVTGVAGHLDGTATAAIIALAVTLRAAAAATGWEMGVASYGRSLKTDFTVTPHRRVATTWDPFFTPLTGFSMDGTADVIRNRKS